MADLEMLSSASTQPQIIVPSTAASPKELSFLDDFLGQGTDHSLLFTLLLEFLFHVLISPISSSSSHLKM